MPDVTFDTFAEVVDAGVIDRVLDKVISRGGQSKKYTDLLPLDGGTVGIAHFAVGGLAELYKLMDTDAFFGRSKEEMIEHYSADCRPTGKHGDDTGWGCYSQPWWRDGMTAFLQSDDSGAIQRAAWAAMMKPVVESAIAHGWNTGRQIAIALGIANSMGRHGFTTLAANAGWNAESALDAYVTDSEHRKRRRKAIDEYFPGS